MRPVCCNILVDPDSIVVTIMIDITITIGLWVCFELRFEIRLVLLRCRYQFCWHHEQLQWTGDVAVVAAEACLGVCLHGIGDAGDDDSSACPVREVQPLTHLPPAPIIQTLLMHPSYSCKLLSCICTVVQPSRSTVVWCHCYHQPHNPVTCRLGMDRAMTVDTTLDEMMQSEQRQAPALCEVSTAA